ncbi:MAG: DUF5692 family protein [Vallitalea sp.]|jgi:hypothetical protein|nr:DUF5692 family protein [Vallitalea sp.]
MGLLFNGVTVSSFIALLLFIAALVGVNELTRRSLKTSILVYCILPVVLAILVLNGVMGSPSGKTWFGWVKVISALTGVYGFLLIRFTKLGDKKFAIIFPVTILSLNIAEAVYREFEVFATYKTSVVDPAGNLILGGTWNLLNGISGILCIVTLTGFIGIKVSKDKFKDMVWPDMTWIYIVAYTLWNFAYVYNCISTRSMYAGFAILLAALISELFIKQGVWLQHRAQILSFYAMFALSVNYQSVNAFRILPTYTESGLLTVSIIAFIFNIGALVFMVYTIVKSNKNPLKEEIYTDTKYYKKSIQVNQL